MVEKKIRWIPPNSRNFKLNFDDRIVKNRSTLCYVIRDFNSMIKMAISRHMR